MEKSSKGKIYWGKHTVLSAIVAIVLKSILMAVLNTMGVKGKCRRLGTLGRVMYFDAGW